MENTIKINIECGNSPRNGYINTTSNANYLNSISEDSGDDINIVLSEVRNAHEIQADVPVSEMVLNIYMNSMTLQEIGEFLSHWTNRLVSGGVMKLKFIDSRQVCRSGGYGSVTLHQLHEMLLGSEQMPFKSLSDFESIQKSFENSYLHITYAKNDGYDIYLEVEKKNENPN